MAGRGVTGSNGDAATCLSMSLKEADVLAAIWNGPTRDGRRDANATPDTRSGKLQATAASFWWSLTRGGSYAGQVTGAATDMLALVMRDVSYSADAASGTGIATVNTSTPRRNHWTEMDYTSYAQAFELAPSLPYVRDYLTNNPDLRKLRDGGRKIVMWNGLVEDVIPPSGAINFTTSAWRPAWAARAKCRSSSACT